MGEGDRRMFCPLAPLKGLGRLVEDCTHYLGSENLWVMGHRLDESASYGNN